jgi:Fe-S cluster biogenesis protein NfuA/nitrite reductase/ring-hydroxylating ferredoxin subunit
MDGGAPAGDGAELDRLLRELGALEALAEGWGPSERAGAEARARAVDALNAEALRRLIRALRAVPEAAGALRAAAADPLVYAVLRRHGILKPSLQERVEAALDTVRPMLASHGGDVELVSVEGAVAEVRFLGACDGCPASTLTFYAGVKKAIESHAPEIAEVRQAKGLGGGRSGEVTFVSPFAAGEGAGWLRALGLAELGDGGTRFVEVAGVALILSRFGDQVTCFADACAHMGLGMAGGPLEDGILTCPHHGFRYALESGECLTAPQVQLQPHPVRVRGGEIEVRLGAAPQEPR